MALNPIIVNHNYDAIAADVDAASEKKFQELNTALKKQQQALQVAEERISADRHDSPQLTSSKAHQDEKSLREALEGMHNEEKVFLESAVDYFRGHDDETSYDSMLLSWAEKQLSEFNHADYTTEGTTQALYDSAIKDTKV